MLKFVQVLVLLCLVSCKKTSSEQEKMIGVYCENEIALFSAPDTLKKIVVSYNQSTDSIVSLVSSQYNKEYCEKMISFSFIKIHNVSVKAQVLKQCDIICFKYPSEVSILLNQKGEILVKQFPIPPDSLSSWIYKNFPNSRDDDLEEIAITWVSQTPEESIEKVFENIVEGYLMKYTALSKELFSKEICDLSVTQVDSLKSKLPFKVILRPRISEPPLKEQL